MSDFTPAAPNDSFISTGEGPLATNTGLKISDDQHSLKVGNRGPTLLEDFYLREKLTHFDHESIPERVVHARGAGAHGYFQSYGPISHLTKANFLNDSSIQTPVFVRFSTAVGSRGSFDLARDIRGFATKFYTNEGVFDLVGNNIPVFFFQDAIKFPDLVHAAKPEPDTEIPQAQTAHDTFWDFISLMPESLHMVMWIMSDRAIPQSYRMMEGFGVNTFRLVSADGKGRFAKFHWKPALGVHSVLWDEALVINGKDPDFHRRDLYEAIKAGSYPEWELGLQIIEEDDEHKFPFDILDATKIIPEELVPVIKVGKLVLNRQPDNFFAESEQVAFCPSHVVPGIDFSHDPLLQGRLFSYLDTQLTRLGGPNFHEIPINRARVQANNNERNGFMRQTINKGRVSYFPNSIGGGCPFQTSVMNGGFSSYPALVEGNTKVRDRPGKFLDHFSQATAFFQSQTDVEKMHIIRAFRFELGRVDIIEIRQRMLCLLTKVDNFLAMSVAAGLGLSIPEPNDTPLNAGVPADQGSAYQPMPPTSNSIILSPATSILKIWKDRGISTRKIAILASDGFNDKDVDELVAAITPLQALPFFIAPHGGTISGAAGTPLKVHFTFLTGSSVLFDAVFVAGGEKSVDALYNDPSASYFVTEAFKHCKAIAGCGEGAKFVRDAMPARVRCTETEGPDEGVVLSPSGFEAEVATKFFSAIAKHRVWAREMVDFARSASAGASPL
jgi:catalase